MAIDSQTFRDTLCRFPAGVTIITVKTGETVHGLTATAFVSVSADPPLIAVVVDHRGRGHALLEQPDAVFAVNILTEGQENLARRFAFVKDDRFAEGDWSTAVTGAPILTDAMAWLDCTIFARQPAGNSTIFIGEVQASSVTDTDEKPLVYWNRCYGMVNLTADEQAG